MTTTTITSTRCDDGSDIIEQNDTDENTVTSSVDKGNDCVEFGTYFCKSKE